MDDSKRAVTGEVPFEGLRDPVPELSMRCSSEEHLLKQVEAAVQAEMSS